ncbi:hypothetical protein KIN20_034849 [Parelaphostrongylus tenuis]|uniref:Fibronectin type III domain protein n=1 Tax=Parelaphostrongylus tenuis TaxID=148309 RepID=A0AAD5RAA1_PARTN|nr:hypothetical protein KIN20_034849 [Parelaphostrongylus tenuis]
MAITLRMLVVVTIMSHVGFCSTVEADFPLLTLNASVNPSLSIQVCVKANLSAFKSSSITGFKVYFTRNTIILSDKLHQWQNVEVLTSQPQYCVQLDANDYDIKPASVYRIRASVLVNQVESSPSKIILLDTREAEFQPSKSPVIKPVKMLANGSAIFEFIPAENGDHIANYMVEFRELSLSGKNEDNWRSVEVQSSAENHVLLPSLMPNRTYEARLRDNDQVMNRRWSKIVTFTMNDTAQLPEVVLDPERIEVDPVVSLPLEVRCDVVSTPLATIDWLVDGKPVEPENLFYNISNVTITEQVASRSVRMKCRTRNANLTCVATNSAGQVSKSVLVRILGPGSPPSSVAVKNEQGAYTVSWLPPLHPNGNLTKYVVYHTFHKDDPLSDWQKLVLDSAENSVRIPSNDEDGFYVRVQAAADSGPGVISDIVAIEKDTIPVTVSINYIDPPGRERLLVEPGEKISARCVARGKPQPQLFYVFSDVNENPEAEEDVWRILDAKAERESVEAEVEFSTLSSKTLHCKAKNVAGSNFSSLTFNVKKPGDPPQDIQVLAIDARDVVIAWKAPKYPNMKIKFYEVRLSEDVEEDVEYWQKYRTSAREDLLLTRLTLPTDQLKPSHIYYIQVRAFNDAGSGPFSDPIHFITPNGGPENPPTGVTVDINEANIAVIRWQRPNSSTEILNYVIYFTRDLGISNEDYREWQTVEVPASQTHYTFDHQIGLKPKTFYRVRVGAKNDVADGPVSETKEFETAYSELPIPTDIRIKVNEDNSLTITFSAVRDPDDHTNVVENYKIELAQSDDVLSAHWFPVNVKTIAVDHVTSKAAIEIDGSILAPNSMYWMKITASLDNPTRFVQASKPRWFRTNDGKLKTRVKMEGGPLVEREPNLFEDLELVCHAEGSPAPEVVWYWNDDKIHSDSLGWSVREEHSDRKTVSVLTRNCVCESGRALCIATNDNSNATDEIEVRVLGPGGSPRNVKAIGWRNQINITWNEPLFPNGVIMKYIVYHATRNAIDLSEWNKVETETTNVVIEAKSAETRYLVRVQAATADGPGIISEPVECYSDSYYEPIVLNLISTNVVNFEAQPNQTVEIICSAQGQPIPRLFYAWENDTEIEATDLLVSTSTHQVSGEIRRSAFTNETVTCRAENKHENVNITRMIIIRKPGDAPTNVSWRFDKNDSLLINWSRVQYPNGNATYVLYLSNFVDRVLGPPIRIPKVPYNVNVTLQISAENEWGEGQKSPPITFLTPHGGPKDAPSITALKSKDGKLTMTWQAPTMPNGEIKRYTIYFKKSEGKRGTTLAVHGSECESLTNHP